jgi:hypothetical protein
MLYGETVVLSPMQYSIDFSSTLWLHPIPVPSRSALQATSLPAGEPHFVGIY